MNITNKARILLIYTGGTIGMKQNPVTSALEPFNFHQILEEVPELNKFVHTIDIHSFDPPVDSSDIKVSTWQEIALLIEGKYDMYDGFVVLHGTDTMSYSASALSFMLDNLSKPVIFTGSQLPIGMLRTDGKENLISAIEIAAAKNNYGMSMVPEVCIFFENQLFRGNRTTKSNAENFNAFRSPNHPPLAEAGIHIRYNTPYIRAHPPAEKKLEVFTSLCTEVAILKIFPGISQATVNATINIPGLKALILETYGSGNAPTEEWFLHDISRAVNKGITVLNVTQCPAGTVDMDAYATGKGLKKIGAISGYDTTTEAAICKLFFLTGHNSNNQIIKDLLVKNLRGEITIS